MIDLVMFLTEHKAELVDMKLEAIHQFAERHLPEATITGRAIKVAAEKVGIEYKRRKRNNRTSYRLTDVAKAALVLVGEIERQVGIDQEALSPEAKAAKGVLQAVVDARSAGGEAASPKNGRPEANGQHRNRLMQREN